MVRLNAAATRTSLERRRYEQGAPPGRCTLPFFIGKRVSKHRSAVGHQHGFTCR
jgi:hypothetical protein